jgi:hypothetical protein
MRNVVDVVNIPHYQIFIDMRKKTQEEYSNEVKKQLPKIRIIDSYVNSRTKIRVEDDFGIKYLVYPNTLLLGITPTIKTAEDVEEFIRIKLYHTLNLTYISGFTSHKEKIYVKDSDNIIYHVSCSDVIRNNPSIPSLRSSVDKNDGFIKKSKKIHHDKYDYSLVDYQDTRKVLNIICKIHGVFQQQPVTHLKGHGCPKCGLEKTIYNLTTNHIGWSILKWTKTGKQNKGNPKLYFVNVYNEEENFIKIGRTYKKINERLAFLVKLGYKYEIIKVVEGNYNFIYNEEKKILNLYKNQKYTPKTKFHGYTECFKIEIKTQINED